MRLITEDGTEMRCLSLTTASTLAVAHLQQLTGLTMKELAEQLSSEWVDLPGLGRVDNHVAGAKVMEFLSEHTRGNMIGWDEIIARAVPMIGKDADEVRRLAESNGFVIAPDPSSAGTDTPVPGVREAHDEEPAPAPARSTPASKPSGARSRGSSTRSARAR